MDLTTRVNLVRSLHSTTEKPEVPVSVAADLCGINRSSIYNSGKPVSDTELECKEITDYLHTDHPTWGARQMAAQLKQRGYHIGRKKARRWMTEMTIDPIYPKPNLSKCLQRAAVVPYLLRNADITRSNQALSIDITYIPMKHGFLYLTAIIDWQFTARLPVSIILLRVLLCGALDRLWCKRKPKSVLESGYKSKKETDLSPGFHCT